MKAVLKKLVILDVNMGDDLKESKKEVKPKKMEQRKCSCLIMTIRVQNFYHPMFKSNC